MSQRITGSSWSLALAGCLAALASCQSDAGTMDGTPFAGSGLGPDEIPLRIDLRCPGDPGCASAGDGTLRAGAAMRDITPLVEPFVDTNGDGFHEPDEPYTDGNGNGQFDPVWIAGYGNGRLAFGVHDGTSVRCYALEQGETTMVHCVVDCVGWFANEQEQVRANLDPALGVDLLMVGATHLHETQDTVGIWGPDETTTGYDPAYMARVRRALVEATTDAVRALRPAKLAVGSIAVEDPSHDLQPYVSDTRDPVVIENHMHVLQFDGDDGKPIVTVLNWASHPESVGSSNHYITADFSYWLRERLGQHTGSPVVYVNGALGGQIGPGAVRPRTDDGTLLPRGERSFRFAEYWGLGLAEFASKAFDQRTPVDKPQLAFRRTRFNAHVENAFYHAASSLHLFRREMFGIDPNLPLIRTAEFDNAPLVATEVAYLTLGPVAIITAPGELLPENFLGGYGGEFTGLYPFIEDMDPRHNPPDIRHAPKPPYLRDLMAMNGFAPERCIVYGATLDFLGYIVPRYNFVLDELGPYVVEAEGDHYEETNSVGPRAEPEIVGTMRQLVMSARATK